MKNRLKNLLTNIKFHAPKKNDVVIFDASGSDLLVNFVLNGIKYTVLPVRYEEFYVSLKLGLLFLKNFFSKFILRRDYRNIPFVYLLSCIEYIQPKVVITFIDNNCVFHAISNVYKKADFYTIQNGLRTMYNVNKMLPKPPRFGSVFKIQNFVCFGLHERDLYESNGHSISKLHPVGSLMGSYFKTQLAKDNEIPIFDLCLVSQWRRLVMVEGCHKDVKDAIDQISDFLLMFIKEKRVSLCVALRSNEREEREYYEKIFGERINFVDFNSEQMSTYSAINKSKVVVTFFSTIGYEALGWGKKVLFCNFSGDKLRDCLVDGFWSINRVDYEEFKNKLEYLFDLDQEEYRNLTSKIVKYAMNYDSTMPVHTYIRNIVLAKLA